MLRLLLGTALLAVISGVSSLNQDCLTRVAANGAPHFARSADSRQHRPFGASTKWGCSRTRPGAAVVLQRQPLTVCAAISLTDALEEIAKAYAKAGGGPVRFNFAGSNVLARQLVNGAPADLFISADEAQMDVAAVAGVIDRASRVDLVGNRLAIVFRREGVQIRAARDLADAGVRRIAVGDPAAVPAGVYARRFLEAIQLWPAVSARIVPVGNVRAALAVVVNGSVDAAIVYESDAAAAPSVHAFIVEGPDAPRIVYPAAIVSRTTDRAAAERFFGFLRGREAAAIFTRHRFRPLDTGR